MRHIDASSVAWTLINNGKLANQIVRFSSNITVVKFTIESPTEIVKSSQATSTSTLMLFITATILTRTEADSQKILCYNYIVC